MEKEEITKQLKKERYNSVYSWKDKPNKIYKNHFHNTETKLIIMKGEIQITTGGVTKNCESGESIIIIKKGKHSAVVGSEGCEYMVGEK